MRGLSTLLVVTAGCGFQITPSGVDPDAGTNGDGAVDAAPPWFAPYQRRRQIDLTPTLAAPLAGQQMLIRASGLTLGPQLSDVAFTTLDGQLLDFELEAVTGASVTAWVEVPMLAPGTATSLYLYYDAPGTAPVEAPAATWNASHLGVFHLTAKAGVYPDSARGNDGAPVNGPTDVAGIAGGAIGIIGGAHVQAGAATTTLMNMTASRSFSYSAWVYVRSSVTGYDVVVFKADDLQDIGWDFQLGTGTWEAAMGRGANMAHAPIGQDGASMRNRWIHLGAILNRGTQQFSSFVDGAPVGSASTSSVGDMSSNYPLLVGFPGWPGDMLIDEVRVYDGVVDPVQFAVEHENLTSHDAVVTIGVEQLAP